MMMMNSEDRLSKAYFDDHDATRKPRKIIVTFGEKLSTEFQEIILDNFYETSNPRAIDIYI